MGVAMRGNWFALSVRGSRCVGGSVELCYGMAFRVLDTVCMLESGGEARKLEGWLWMGRLSSAILRRLFAEVCGYLVLEGQERVLHRL